MTFAQQPVTLRVPMRALLAVSLFAGLVAAQTPVAEPLFDGKSLAGWKGDPAIWRVEDGCIVGSSVGQNLQRNTFLVLDGKEPANFEFTVQVRLEGDNNSGVQYRSRVLPGDGFRVGGYQCDLHGAPNYTAMLYDEQGAGIVAERGQFVRWRDDGHRSLGAMVRVEPVDLGQWHTLRIVACGDLVWHELDGQACTAVKDERTAAPKQGVLALQVHGGAPMTIRCKQPVLRTWTDLAAMRAQCPPPPMCAALLRAEAAKAAQQPTGPVPQWLWDAEAGQDEELFFRRTFELAGVPKDAQLVVACDNHCRIYVNGTKVGEGDDWAAPVRVDVTKSLQAGANVLAVHGWNEGGPAALAARLSWSLDGKAAEFVSDASWRCSDDDADGWNTAGFDGKAWQPVKVLAALGDKKAPWSSAHGSEAFGAAGDPFAPQIALVDTKVAFAERGRVGKAPEVLKLFDVPKALGSWVSLALDPQGRVYAGAQGGGLYRVTPARSLGEPTTVEKVAVTLDGAHGLLWWKDSLYAVVNERNAGLYRLTDTNGDDALDRVELLQKLEGNGEHGPHSVIEAPDGEHLLVVAGNQTKLPQLARSRVPQNWAEDRVLPRLDEPHRYTEGISPPGGWVCQCDADGKDWELICCGFRNPYDIAIVDGRVIAYDSDMEWDMGLPWYRPTRLLAVESGVDYGWRIGSAKWPADYPDAPPAVKDIGPGSPTGVHAVFDLYADAQHLLALDWTFGVAYLDGERFLSGVPLPLTDVAVGVDVTYLATGGRGLPSSLLLVRFGHNMQPPPFLGRAPKVLPFSPPWEPQEARTPVAILDTVADPAAPIPAAFARIALERLPVAQYRSEALAVDGNRPTRSLTGLHALTRHGAAADLQPVLDALGKLPFGPLAHADRIAWLRVHALALLRLGPATDAQRTAVAQRLLPLFPTGDERQDQDLCELLAYLDAPGLLDKAVPLLAELKPSPVPAWANIEEGSDVYGNDYSAVVAGMAKSMPPLGQLAIANALRIVTHGWTLQQRRTYFTFLQQARTRKGGASYDGFLKKMVDAAYATCTPAEQQVLAELVGAAKADAPKFASVPPKGPGRDWQVADIDAVLKDGIAGGDIARGRNLFHAASCAGCHYFAGEGGNHGPDLTSLGNKFTARDVLEAILEPSKVVSDQYVGQVLTKKDGSTLFGFVQKAFHGDHEVYEVMPAAAEAQLVRVPVADMKTLERAVLSPMPTDLVDRLSAAELRDLLAFLLSRGQVR